MGNYLVMDERITISLKNPNDASIVITLKRSVLEACEYFRGDTHFAEGQGVEKSQLAMEVEPPVPDRFLECLSFLAGDELPPHRIRGSNGVEVLLNADFLGIKSFLAKCYERWEMSLLFQRSYISLR